MFEVFRSSQATLEPILLMVSVFAAFTLTVPALAKLPMLAEVFKRFTRARSRGPIAVVDLTSDEPSPSLLGPVGNLSRDTRALLANIGGFASEAASWPTDDLDIKSTGLFAGGRDLDRVTYVTREVFEWVRSFDRLPLHVREELAALDITAEPIRRELVAEDEFFDRLRRIVSTLHAFDLRLQQQGTHPFRGLAAPTPQLSTRTEIETRRDEDARRAEYEQVMAEHGATISRIAGRYAKQASEREDLEQDIALAIWRALPRFRGESSVRTYVLRIAHNCGCAHRKKKRLLPTDAEVEDVTKCPESGAVTRERRRHLTGAIAELPSTLRDVLKLRLLGHSYAEISDELRITETNVSVRLTRARRFLKERLLPAS